MTTKQVSFGVIIFATISLTMIGCGGGDSAGSLNSGVQEKNPDVHNRLIGQWAGNCVLTGAGSKKEYYVIDEAEINNEVREYRGTNCDKNSELSRSSVVYKYVVGSDTFGSDDLLAYEIDMTYNYTYTLYSMFRFDSNNNLLFAGNEASSNGNETTEAPSSATGAKDGSTPESRLDTFDPDKFYHSEPVTM